MKRKLSSVITMIALAMLSTTTATMAATHSPRTSDAPFFSAAADIPAAFEVPSSISPSADAHRYHGGPKADD